MAVTEFSGDLPREATLRSSDTLFITMAAVSGVLLALMTLDYTTKLLSPLMFKWTTTAIFAIGAYLQILFLQRRRMVLFAFNLFFLYDIFPVWLVNYMMGIEFSSWRAGRFAPHEIQHILSIIMVYICCYYVLVFLLLIHLEKTGPDPRAAAIFDLRGGAAGKAIFMLLCFGVAALGIYGAGTVPRLAVISLEVQENFVIRISMAALMALFAIAMFRSEKTTTLLSPSLLAMFASGVLIGLNGYRNTTVAIFLLVGIHYVLFHKITPRTIFLGVFGFLPTLFGFVMLGIARRFWLSPVALLTSGVISKIPINEILKNFGVPQQSDFVATGHFLHLHQFLWGRTYLESIINVLPNFMRTYFGAEYPQVYVINAMQGVLPVSFLDQAETLGAAMNLEAMLNWGVWGPPIALVGFVLFMVWLEKHRLRGLYMNVLYLNVAATMFFPTWYGSTDFLKTSVAFPLASSLLIFIVLKLFGTTPTHRVYVRAE